MSRSTVATTAIAAVLAAAVPIAGGAVAGGVEIVSIGGLPDADPSIPTPPGSSGNAINASGVVAGGSIISGGSIEREPGIIIAEPVIPHPVRYTGEPLEDLGIPGGDVPPAEYPKPTAIAWGVNGNGWIVGEYVPVEDFLFHAFVWLPEPSGGLPAGFTELPWISERARAWAINDDGIVAGESRLEGELGIEAVFWTLDDGAWTVHSLGTFGGPSSAAYGVNAHGQITGFAGVADGGVARLFLYLPQPDYGLPAGMNNLTPELPGALGNDLNDHGQIVGRGDVWLPMIWLPEPAYGLPAGATVFPAGEVADQEALDLIGSLGLGLAEFTAINDNGDAVGWGEFAVELPNGNIGFARHAIAWIDGEFSLVQQLLPEGSTWTRITNAWDINDAGQITGSGIDGDIVGIGYVLSLAQCPADATGDGVVDVADLTAVILAWGPCPAPCAADIDGSGTVDVQDLVIVIQSWGACP